MSNTSASTSSDPPKDKFDMKLGSNCPPLFCFLQTTLTQTLLDYLHHTLWLAFLFPFPFPYHGLRVGLRGHPLPPRGRYKPWTTRFEA